MADPISESGINFVSDNCFRIEKSKAYTDLGKGVKSIDFVRVKDNYLLFVEAKTAFPNPYNPDLENLERSHSEINEVRDKFIHSLSLFSSIYVGVSENAFTDIIIMPKKVSLMFILVIKTHKPNWCRRVKTALIDALPSYLKLIWKPTIYVINQATAVKRDLVKS